MLFLILLLSPHLLCRIRGIIRLIQWKHRLGHCDSSTQIIVTKITCWDACLITVLYHPNRLMIVYQLYVSLHHDCNYRLVIFHYRRWYLGPVPPALLQCKSKAWRPILTASVMQLKPSKIVIGPQAQNINRSIQITKLRGGHHKLSQTILKKPRWMQHCQPVTE